MATKQKNNMSNIDIYVIAKELNEILEGGFIDNIYEINDNLLQIKCRSKQGTKILILDSSKRINLTNYSYPIPPFPSQYCSALRKYMKGRRILKVYQYGLDRLLVFELGNKDGAPWKFIVELFLGGNFILIDDEDRTFMAKHYKIIKGRKILAKKPYLYPEIRGKSFLDIDKEEFTLIISNSDIDLVRTISRSISLVGYLAEEICILSNIDKNTICKDLSLEQIDILYNKIEEFKQKLNEKSTSVIYQDDSGKNLFFEPFELQIHSGLKFKEYNTFNDAVDDFFSKQDSEMLLSSELKNADKIVGKYQRIKDSQVEQIKESIDKREEHLELGNLIYANFDIVESLLKTIFNARKSGMNWKEIEGRMKAGKEKGIKEALIFHKTYPKEAKVAIKLEDNIIKLDFRKNVVENATELYKLAKKDKRRIQGAKIALEKTEKILEEKIFEKEIKEKQNITLIKRPKKAWFEKYRWFKSSDDFIVVGGRDASSNEVIVKKHMEPSDFFFHTELRGAPCVILKNPEKKKISEIPELTLKETATFAASYSSAWKAGWGSTKIFYVNPDQVTKSPNPGEFLTKGSFFIKGQKNFLPPPFLELAIGLVLEQVGEMESEEEAGNDSIEKNIESNEVDEKSKEDNENQDNSVDEENEDNSIYFPRIIAGPLSSVKKRTDNYVRLKPQKSSIIKGGKLADKVIMILISKTKEELKKWAKLIDQKDVMQFIPPGGSVIGK